MREREREIERAEKQIKIEIAKHKKLIYLNKPFKPLFDGDFLERC